MGAVDLLAFIDYTHIHRAYPKRLNPLYVHNKHQSKKHP